MLRYFPIISNLNRINNRGSCRKGSHVYFLLQVFWVILLFDINVVLMLPWWPDITIVQSDITVVVPWQLSTGSIHDYPFLILPPSGYSIWGTENWSGPTFHTFTCNIFNLTHFNVVTLRALRADKFSLFKHAIMVSILVFCHGNNKVINYKLWT